MKGLFGKIAKWFGIGAVGGAGLTVGASAISGTGSLLEYIILAGVIIAGIVLIIRLSK